MLSSCKDCANDRAESGGLSGLYETQIQNIHKGLVVLASVIFYAIQEKEQKNAGRTFALLQSGTRIEITLPANTAVTVLQVFSVCKSSVRTSKYSGVNLCPLTISVKH